MSFGRQKNLARRPYRPDGSFHRERRRKRLNHPFALSNGLGLGSLLGFLLRPFRRR
jgi:hypothetical protein